MSTINIVFLVIVYLFVIAGFIKGFKQKTVRSAAFLSGVALAYFVGVPLSNVLMYTPFCNETITGLFLRNIVDEGIFAQKLSTDLTEQTAQLSNGLSELKIPTIFHGLFISRVYYSAGSVRDALSTSFASTAILGTLFILFFIAGFVIVKIILKKTTGVLFSEDGNNLAGRIFGGIRGFLYASIILVGVMFVAVLVNQVLLRYGLLKFNNMLDSQLGLSDGAKFSLGKMYYNTAAALLNWISLI